MAAKPCSASIHASFSAPDLVELELVALITSQRLDNVLSKHGRVDPTDTGACRALLRAFKADILDAFLDGQGCSLEDASGGAGTVYRELLVVLEREAKQTISNRLRSRQSGGR